MRADTKQTIASPVGAGGTFTYTGTAGVSGTLPTGISGVMIWGTTDMYVVLGVGVSATTANWPIPSFTPVFIPNLNEVGGNVVVSAIQISAGGSAYYQPMA